MKIIIAKKIYFVFYINIFIGGILNSININYYTNTSFTKKNINKNANNPNMFFTNDKLTNPEKKLSLNTVSMFAIIGSSLFLVKSLPKVKNVCANLVNNLKNKNAIKENPTLVLMPHGKPMLALKPHKKPIILPDEEHLSHVFTRLYNVWHKDGFVLPEKIDEILTNKVGEKYTRELPFYTDNKRGIFEGRKMSYKTRSGNIFVLESHYGKKGLITRCYMAIKKNANSPLTKEQRLYLGPSGTFEPDVYFSNDTHLKSSENSLKWILNKSSSDKTWLS